MKCIVCEKETGHVWTDLCDVHRKIYFRLTANRTHKDRPLTPDEIKNEKICEKLDIGFVSGL